MEPKSIQNDSKSKSIFKNGKIPFKTVLEPSWSRLGPILGHLDRAWGHLGAILGRLGEQKPLIFLRIFTIFEKSRFYIKKVILAGLEAILGRLGAILVTPSLPSASERIATATLHTPFSHPNST